MGAKILQWAVAYYCRQRYGTVKGAQAAPKITQAIEATAAILDEAFAAPASRPWEASEGAGIPSGAPGDDLSVTRVPGAEDAAKGAVK